MIAILFSGSAICASTTSSEKTKLREYQLKAAFLVGFADFISWEDDTLKKTNPLKIGIIGKGPIEKMLKQAKRHVEIHYFNQINDIEPVHLLYINANTNINLEEVFHKCEEYNIVNVSDAPSFANKGGMIQFLKVKNRFKFRINKNSIEGINVQLSSKLVRLSHTDKS